MRQRLIATDLAIGELLGGGYSFSIPAYQRDYTWTREEALQLVDDVAAVIEDVERDGAQTPYFLGTMLLIEPVGGAADGRAPTPVEVVDGQQRLITLTILFSVLRDMADGGAEGPEGRSIDRCVAASEWKAGRRAHLALRAADETFFATAIQQPGATRRGQLPGQIGDSIARRNIEDVRRALRTKMQREFSEGERGEFLAFVTSNVRVLVVVSDDFDYAYQIFLTINDRGKRLSVEDIFRGEILGPLDREQRLRYEGIIDEMEKYREEAEQTRTKGKTFFSHLATIDGWPRRGIIEGLKQAVERRGGPRRFVAEMFAPMAESYLQIKGGGSLTSDQEVQERLLKLRWLELHGDDDWVPVAMVGIDRLKGEAGALSPFLLHLDRFAHGLLALGCGREARRRHYTPILQQMLATSRVPEPATLFAITKSNQKAILRNIATRLHIIDPPTARLILLRVDQEISKQSSAAYLPFIARDRKDPESFTVEHVCPKGRLEQGDWLRLFPRRSLRERAAECIGNLALVTDAQNRYSGQQDFSDKMALFFPGGEPSLFHLTNLIGEERDWDGLAIARRYNLIMTTIREMWSLVGAIPVCPALGRSPMPRPGPEDDAV